MRETDARKKIEDCGGDWEIFLEWMRGQTVSVDEFGYINIYSHDVDRFIRYNCDPSNEPYVEWD